MPKGQVKFSIRQSEYDNEEVEKFLEGSKYADHTKQFIRMVLVEKKTLQEAGDAHGVSRQLVYKRCRDVLERLGVDLRIPANDK